MEHFLLLAVLSDNKFVHIIINRVDSVKIIFNVQEYPGDILVDALKFMIDTPNTLFCLLTFFQDMVVALVLLELQ